MSGKNTITIHEGPDSSGRHRFTLSWWDEDLSRFRGQEYHALLAPFIERERARGREYGVFFRDIRGRLYPTKEWNSESPPWASGGES